MSRVAPAKPFFRNGDFITLDPSSREPTVRGPRPRLADRLADLATMRAARWAESDPGRESTPQPEDEPGNQPPATGAVVAAAHIVHVMREQQRLLDRSGETSHPQGQRPAQSLLGETQVATDALSRAIAEAQAAVAFEASELHYAPGIERSRPSAQVSAQAASHFQQERPPMIIERAYAERTAGRSERPQPAPPKRIVPFVAGVSVALVLGAAVFAYLQLT